MIETFEISFPNSHMDSLCKLKENNLYTFIFTPCQKQKEIKKEEQINVNLHVIFVT